jgi:predicted nucleic acid-binding protein
MIVADASALFDVLRRRPTATAIEARLLGSGLTLHVPHLIDAEIAQVVRWHTMTGDLPPQRASEMLTDLVRLPLQRYPHDWLLPRVWDLRHNLTAYDAIYIALAEALGAPLVTRDARLAGAPGHGAAVEVM